jgi:hypothetical protein
LLALTAYNTPLRLAAAAAQILGVDPSPLNSFAALAGRMTVSCENNIVIVDNANSGTNFITTVDAARYARKTAGGDEVTLVIGQQMGDGAVCEGFMPDQVLATVEAVSPANLIWVGRFPEPGTTGYICLGPRVSAHVQTLDEGLALAKRRTPRGSIVLAVKTWR